MNCHSVRAFLKLGSFKMTFVLVIGGRTGAELRIAFANEDARKSVMILSILAILSIFSRVSASIRMTSSKLSCAIYSVR